MLNEQHLSDEAVAACADGVLGGAAQERAARHIATCGECAHAVRGQREAVRALRAAAPPALPAQLLDRLREVPQTTPIRTLPTAIGPDGTAVLGSGAVLGSATALGSGAGIGRNGGFGFGSMAPMAAFAPAPARRGGHRTRNAVIAAAVVALTGAITAGTVAHADGNSNGSGPARSGTHSRGSVPGGAVVVHHIAH